MLSGGPRFVWAGMTSPNGLADGLLLVAVGVLPTALVFLAMLQHKNSSERSRGATREETSKPDNPERVQATANRFTARRYAGLVSTAATTDSPSGNSSLDALLGNAKFEPLGVDASDLIQQIRHECLEPTMELTGDSILNLIEETLSRAENTGGVPSSSADTAILPEHGPERSL